MDIARDGKRPGLTSVCIHEGVSRGGLHKQEMAVPDHVDVDGPMPDLHCESFFCHFDCRRSL